MSRWSTALRKLPAVALAVLLCSYAQLSVAQVYDSFRLAGDHPAAASGFVTSISFDANAERVTVNYLNVAGVSSILEAELTPSVAIPVATPVFLPDAGFLDDTPPSLDLEQIQFYNGRFSEADGTTAPDHWFRLTRFNDQFSGVFRIDNRIYAINRYNADPTVLVHPAKQNNNNFLANRRVRVSAIIDEQFLQADTVGDRQGMDNLGHLFALESINVMDGLLTDGLGISVVLEQLIYQPSTSLSIVAQPNDLIAGAQSWYGNNADAFGLTDNIATLYFRGAAGVQANAPNSHPQLAHTSDTMVIQGNSANYQFATAHYFAALLGINNEPGTLQDWQTSGSLALPNVHWSDQQRSLLALNPPPAEFTQIISNDAPDVAVQPEQPINEVDSQLVLAESPEGGGLINDDGFDNVSSPATTQSGGGAFAGVLLLLMMVPGYRVARCHGT
jgi:hypothetical protein